PPGEDLLVGQRCEENVGPQVEPCERFVDLLPAEVLRQAFAEVGEENATWSAGDGGCDLVVGLADVVHGALDRGWPAWRLGRGGCRRRGGRSCRCLGCGGCGGPAGPGLRLCRGLCGGAPGWRAACGGAERLVGLPRAGVAAAGDAGGDVGDALAAPDAGGVLLPHAAEDVAGFGGGRGDPRVFL